MAEVALRHVVKTFQNQTVIKNIDLTIPHGSFTVLVGPSGCGKSTTLRMIAGLDQPSSGDIFIDNKKVNHLEPGKREIAMVFQNYALYPTMSVKENIEFGLKNRKVPKLERNRLVTEIAEVVGLTDYLHRKPSELSGGQRQRVALARAMVKKPKVFLMDEPLSNLDAQLRQQMRMELMELHKKLEATFIYVTHDQTEALSMGDQIIIMNKGEVQQAGSPMEVYHRPTNRFVSTFIGTPPMNIVAVKPVLQQLPGINSRVHEVGIRPEKILLHQDDVRIKRPHSLVLDGNIVAHEMLGAETLYYVETILGRLIVKCYGNHLDSNPNVQVEFHYEDIHLFGAKGERLSGEKSVNWQEAECEAL